MNGTLFCTKCGAANPANAQFCGRCGATTGPSTVVPSTPATVSGAYPPAVGYSSATAGVRYGGFWIRVVATIIDGVLVRIVVAPFGMIFGLGGFALGGFGHGGLLPQLLGGGVIVLLTLAGSWLYEAYMESSSYQATLGKMIFGMKVTDLSGNRISFGRATGRHFAKILSGMILFIGFIMVGLSERKQGLHDLIAGTLVRRF